MFGRMRRERQLKSQARTLYNAIMGLVRRPEIYRDMGVPDTFEGRFEVLALVTCLVLRRLRGGGEAVRPLAQTLVDTLFDDMDIVLREAGISDTALSKKARTMASAFYGRAKAYDEAFAADGEAALCAALARNVLGEASRDAGALSAFVRALEQALAAWSVGELAEGHLPPTGMASAAA